MNALLRQPRLGREVYIIYIVRRTQVYLDERQTERLDCRARAAGVTRSTLIREAVDRMLDEPEDVATALEHFRGALRATFGVAPDLEPGGEYVASLRSGDMRRLSDIEPDAAT